LGTLGAGIFASLSQTGLKRGTGGNRENGEEVTNLVFEISKGKQGLNGQSICLAVLKVRVDVTYLRTDPERAPSLAPQAPPSKS
jgi:hypothetical protein